MTKPAHPAEPDILRQVHWVRGLAFGILRDHELAQDVSQDVLLKALEGEPRQGSVLKAWLAAVTRHRALSVLRERRRRGERERRVARPESVPPERAPSEILEAHRALAQAIDGLPQASRELVLLRYYEEREFPELARRLGITENAARVRLHRALGQIRANLERQGADWRALCLQALPAGFLAAPSGAGILPEILAMKGAKSAAFAVLALLLLLLALLQSDFGVDRRAGPDDATAALAGSAPSRNEQDAFLVPAATELQREEAPAKSDGAAWVIRGAARHSAATPAAHARIRAVLREGYDEECPILQEEVLVADAAGVFSWSLPAPETARHVSVQPENGSGWGSSRLALVGQAAPQDLEVTVIRYGGSLTGTVRGPSREPIEGATVFSGQRSAVTDRDGLYHLETILDRTETTVFARAKGMAQAQLEVPLSPGQEAHADFVLAPEFVVRGRVVDEAGSPVEGARVAALQSYKNDSLTGADGRYELHHLLRTGSEYRIRALRQGYCEASAQIKADGNAAGELDIVLRRGAVVSGQVAGPDGLPLEGATLYIGFHPNASNRLDSVAHVDGRFRFANVPPGDQILVAEYPKLAQSRLEFHVAETDREIAGLQLALEAGRVVRGRVTDAEGGALAGAWITVSKNREEVGARVRSDAEGRFAVEDAPATGASIGIYQEGYVRRTLDLDHVAEVELLVVMERCGGLSGTVADAGTGMPLDSFTIRFRHPMTLAPGETALTDYPGSWVDGRDFRGAAGRWTTGAILEPGGIVDVEASAPGYGPLLLERAVVRSESDPAMLHFELQPAAVLRGRVVSERGEPVALAAVRPLDSEAMDENRFVDLDQLPCVFTDSAGEFTLVELSPGEIHLLVEHADWVRNLDGPVTLASGDENPPRVITLTPGTSLRGFVRAADGTPIAGAHISAHGRSGPNLSNRIRETLTDADGRFEIAHLPPGRYQLIGGRRERGLQVDAYSLLCTLPPDRDREVLLQPVGTCTVRGRILFPVAAPEVQRPLRVTLHVSSQEPEDPEAVVLQERSVTAVGDTFMFEGVPENAPYSVMIWAHGLDGKPGYMGSTRFRTDSGLEYEIDIVLKPSNL